MEPPTIIAVLAAALIAGGFIGLLANLARRDQEESRLQDHLKERSGLLEKRIAIRRRRKERLRELRVVLEARKCAKPPSCKNSDSTGSVKRASPPSIPEAHPAPVPEEGPGLRAKISKTVKERPAETIAALRLMIKGEDP
jgi:hypothetical protein